MESTYNFKSNVLFAGVKTMVLKFPTDDNGCGLTGRPGYLRSSRERQRRDGSVQGLALEQLVAGEAGHVGDSRGSALVVKVTQWVHGLTQDGAHPEAKAGRYAVHQSKPRQLRAMVDNHLQS